MNYDQAIRTIRQWRFLEAHHHLINPRLYSPHEINKRNHALLLARWLEASSA